MLTIISVFLAALAIYFALGLLYGLYFILSGATKIDPLLKNSKKGIRLQLLPGIIATWPFFIKKGFKTKTNSL